MHINYICFSIHGLCNSWSAAHRNPSFSPLRNASSEISAPPLHPPTLNREVKDYRVWFIKNVLFCLQFISPSIVSHPLREASVEPQPGCTDKRRKPTGRRKQAAEKHGLPHHGRKLKGEMGMIKSSLILF